MDDVAREELAEFIGIPSVSADPAHREVVKACGRVGRRVHPLEVRRHRGAHPWGEKDLALGEVPRRPTPRTQPTVLVYGTSTSSRRRRSTSGRPTRSS